MIVDAPEVQTALGKDLAFAGSSADEPTVTSATGAKTVDPDIAMPVVDGACLRQRLHQLIDRRPILAVTARGVVATQSAEPETAFDENPSSNEVRPHQGDMRGHMPPFAAADDGALSFADLVVDPATRRAVRAGVHLKFTRREFRLLEVFLRHPNQVLTREAIQDQVWGEETDFDTISNSLGVYVYYLRRKLETGGAPRLIHTVYGIGYQLAQR
ncbi:winged helix-turn-helix domain-containing protein [Streptomyces kronopolitis]|uniref:winged helix-turn-helix domain-containing protein n=1 Tax=Streptomyces kronopolitis TaxID=1612435 RepID=UPI0036982C78